MLGIDSFNFLLKNAPLVSIDIVLVRSDCSILFGKRINEPAKGYLFLPGGRILKNESLDNAFKRIALEELNMKSKLSDSRFLGVYEHFYENSFTKDDVSTHYISLTYALNVKGHNFYFPTNVQHSNYRWLYHTQISSSNEVHENSKKFLIDF